jgi:hypothetical protein
MSTWPRIKDIQRRVAQVAISASAVRGQREPGLVGPIRNVLTKIDLRGFGTSNEHSFFNALDTETKELEDIIPWGLARKCLNIFLRDAFYTAYLCNEFNLAEAEKWYEVPLDSHVAKGLRKLVKKSQLNVALPQWETIKDLERLVSDKYQNAAVLVAQAEKLPGRVHLDLILWRATTA